MARISDGSTRAWESYRKQIAKYGFWEKMEIRQILQTVLGDLTKIRNSYVHGSGIVGKGKECRIKNCEILKWFKSGDKLIFTISHVFDFLHHLGLLQAILTEGTKTSDLKLVWLLKKGTVWNSIGRKVISVEDSGITDGKPDTRLFRVLFDNGLFGVFKLDSKKVKSFKRVKIVRGNLKFNNGININSKDLYMELKKNFPPKENWSQDWGFKVTGISELTFLSGEMNPKTSQAKVVEVDIDN